MKARAKRYSDLEWTNRVQELIGLHTKWITRGKNKGHGHGNTRVWLNVLIDDVFRAVSQRKGAYDPNLAICSLLGRILVVWYCSCHRAKGLDPRRPLWRARVLKGLAKYRSALISAITSDELMVKAFPNQPWNFPWGKDRKGGTFV